MALIIIILLMYLLIVILAVDLYKKIFKNRDPVLIILYILFWPITGSITGLVFFFILVYEIAISVWDNFKGSKPFK